MSIPDRRLFGNSIIRYLVCGDGGRRRDHSLIPTQHCMYVLCSHVDHSRNSAGMKAR